MIHGGRLAIMTQYLQLSELALRNKPPHFPGAWPGPFDVLAADASSAARTMSGPRKSA